MKCCYSRTVVYVQTVSHELQEVVQVLDGTIIILFVIAVTNKETKDCFVLSVERLTDSSPVMLCYYVLPVKSKFVFVKLVYTFITLIFRSSYSKTLTNHFRISIPIRIQKGHKVSPLTIQLSIFFSTLLT